MVAHIRNLCVKHADDSEIFPDDHGNVLRFEPDIDYGLLLVMAGVFSSVRHARDYNYIGNVPIGWQDFQIGSNRVYIFNPSEPDGCPWFDVDGGRRGGGWQSGS